MTLLSSRTHKRQFASAIVLTTIIAGCHDERVAGPPPAPRIPIRADYQPGQLLGTYSPPVPPENNVSYTWQNTGITLPAGVIELVSVTGHIPFSANQAFTTCSQQSVPTLPGGNTDPGPAGLDQSHQYAVVIGIGDANNAPSGNLGTLQPQQASADSVSLVIQGPGVLWASRPSFYASNCTSQATGYQPAYFVSGDQVLTVRVLAQPVIVLDKSTVVAGDTVTGQVQVDWTTDLLAWYWSWAPDPTNGGPATTVSGCGWGSPTCTVVVQGNGHLEIPSLRVNQTIWTTAASPPIHVVPPHLSVTASPQSVPANNQVTFVATVTPSTNWSISTWQWTPDSGTGGISPNGCQPSEKTCTRSISISGWMKATSTIGSYTLADSVHVNVIRCPTGRGPLDDPAVRDSLMAAYSKSLATNLEVVGAVFYDSLHHYYFVIPLTSTSSQCTASYSPPDPSTATPWQFLVAIFHTHPYNVYSNQYCPFFGPYTGLPGGSDSDWVTFNKIQQYPSYVQASWNNFEYWVINGNYVHVMGPGKKKGSETKSGTTQFPWSSSSCHW